MKIGKQLLVWFLVAPWVYAHPGHLEVKDEAPAALPKVVGHNGLTYEVDTSWAKADRKTAPVRNGHALGESKVGQIYFVTDHLDAAFHVFEKDGTYVRSFGEGLTGGHGLEIYEKDGKEYIIHVDSGWHANPDGGKTLDRRGKITVLTLEGEKVMEFESPKSKRFKPCDVAVLPNGHFLVVDGYNSDFIYEHDSSGKIVKRWGGKKKGAPEHLDNAHGISVDTTDPEKPLVWVSSRNQQMIKAFTPEGEYVEAIEIPGAYAGQLVVRDGKMYSAVCWSKERGNLESKPQPSSGFVVVLDAKTRKVISAPGANEPVYVDGALQPLFQKDKIFRHGHDLYVDSSGAIYVCEWASGGRLPIKLTPVR